MDKPSYYAFPAPKKTRDPRRSSIPQGQEKETVLVRVRAAGRGGLFPQGSGGVRERRERRTREKLPRASEAN